MHSHRRSFAIAAATSLAVIAMSSVARAEKTRVAAGPSDLADGYGYVFSDDVMQAGAFTPNDPRIVVVKQGARVTLIRPRMSFVAELFKSVETL